MNKIAFSHLKKFKGFHFEVCYDLIILNKLIRKWILFIIYYSKNELIEKLKLLGPSETGTKPFKETGAKPYKKTGAKSYEETGAKPFEETLSKLISSLNTLDISKPPLFDRAASD